MPNLKLNCQIWVAEKLTRHQPTKTTGRVGSNLFWVKTDGSQWWRSQQISSKSGWISTDLVEIQPNLDRPHRDLVGVAFRERSPIGSIGLCFSYEDAPTDSLDSGSENENPSPTIASGGLGRFRFRLDGLGGWVRSWVRMDSPS